MHTEKTPLLIGIRAAKANFIPGLIVQAMMVGLVVSYYFVPSAQHWFGILADAKAHYGYGFSLVASAIAGGILPEIFVVLFFQKGKFVGQNWHNMAFAMALWGTEGCVVDLFYRYQAVWFGSQADVATVFKKVLVDQFIYTPFIATPYGIYLYAWKNQGYASKGMSRVLSPAFYLQKCLPALIASWGVWIPLVTVIYSLPSLLQVPLFILALTFWAMIFAYINTVNKTVPATVPVTPPPTGSVGNA